jgi:hypothetical protein
MRLDHPRMRRDGRTAWPPGHKTPGTLDCECPAQLIPDRIKLLHPPLYRAALLIPLVEQPLELGQISPLARQQKRRHQRPTPHPVMKPVRSILPIVRRKIHDIAMLNHHIPPTPDLVSQQLFRLRQDLRAPRLQRARPRPLAFVRNSSASATIARDGANLSPMPPPRLPTRQPQRRQRLAIRNVPDRPLQPLWILTPIHHLLDEMFGQSTSVRTTSSCNSSYGFTLPLNPFVDNRDHQLITGSGLDETAQTSD